MQTYKFTVIFIFPDDGTLIEYIIIAGTKLYILDRNDLAMLYAEKAITCTFTVRQLK